MCGIAGIIAPRGLQHEELSRMSSALQHRGPDGYGSMLYSPEAGVRVGLNQPIQGAAHSHDVVGLAHCRLAIVDLSTASLQPMLDDSRTFCLSYNGEIYNYLELRTELEGLGYSFTTTGDVEVLLRAYEAWGPDCQRRFNGMWAFALLDLRDQVVILSRDRFGIKPLYYTTHRGAVYFASEIKGLLAVPTLPCEPNERVVARYLLTGIVDDSEETFFAGIAQLPAAHWVAISLRSGEPRVSPQPYWSFPTGTFEGSARDAAASLRDLFLDAVKVHAQCDVPVGTCLSGGLDSSAIVSVAERLRGSNEIPNYTHNAFGYRSDDDQFSETPFMEIVAAATAARMHYVEVRQHQFQARVQDVIRAQDEPFGSASILAQWFVFQRAKACGMTVMLDGQGADEILAGYHGYFSTVALQLLRHGRIRDYLALRARYEAEIGPFPASQRSLLQILAPPAMQVAARAVWRRLPRPDSPPDPTADMRAVMTPELFGRHAESPVLRPAANSTLRDVLQHDVRSGGLPALLRYEDRNSMAHSIEARVPFLDHRLVEFLFTLPDEWKINGTETKYVLREAMRGILPETIRTRRDKIGFKATPDWTFAFVRHHRDEILRNQTECERRWFDPAGLKRFLDDDDRTVAAEFALWRILNTKLWARQFWGEDRPSQIHDLVPSVEWDRVGVAAT